MTLSDFIVEYGIFATYIFLGVGILLALIFPAIQMVREFKKALKTLIGVGALILVFMLCYWMSTGEAVTISGISVSAGVMQIVEACLYLAYLMMAVAILAIVLTSFARYLK